MKYREQGQESEIKRKSPRRPLSPYVGLGFLLLAVVVALLRLVGVIG